MLVPQALDQDDPLACPPPLFKREAAAARSEAPEGKNPGVPRVLLANPRWERRFIRFVESFSVGRTMLDGTNEDGARAAKVDEWVVWETTERIAPRGEG